MVGEGFQMRIHRPPSDLAQRITLRWMAVNEKPVCLPSWLRLLNKSEQACADRFHFEADRVSYIASHALLRVLLSTVGDVEAEHWRFVSAPGGKPEIHPDLGHSELRFSLSHTRGLVACAVGHYHDVGVDVELCGRGSGALEIAQKYFAPAEAALLADAPPAQRGLMFARIWTLKEAYVKATGKGLATPLDAFTLTLDPLGIAFTAAIPDRADDWQFAEMSPGPDHRLAIAVRRAAAAPILLDAASVMELCSLRPCPIIA